MAQKYKYSHETYKGLRADDNMTWIEKYGSLVVPALISLLIGVGTVFMTFQVTLLKVENIEKTNREIYISMREIKAEIKTIEYFHTLIAKEHFLNLEDVPVKK